MNIRTNAGSVDIKLNTDRLDKQMMEAQKYLNEMVVSDSTPYIPFQQGQLRSQVWYPGGPYGGSVEWYAPYAHYQYMGELYLTEDGRSFAEKGETKVPTGQPLSYHHKGTGSKWFETAKEVNKEKWIREVKRIAGGK